MPDILMWTCQITRGQTPISIADSTNKEILKVLSQYTASLPISKAPITGIMKDFGIELSVADCSGPESIKFDYQDYLSQLDQDEKEQETKKILYEIMRIRNYARAVTKLSSSSTKAHDEDSCSDTDELL